MSLLNRAHAITRHIYKNQLFDWIMAITKAIAGSPALIGVGPYATVARASASRMLDEDAGLLAGIENGAEVWAESFGGSTWVWRTDFPAATATDNETTCRPTAWIATANDGAFVRELQGSRVALGQTAFFVNSTAADNEGAGTALDPLKNDLEIQRRWGVGKRAQLAVPVTIAYAQSPSTQTRLLFELTETGALTFVGTPTVTKAGTVLTAVTVQNRGTQTRWAVTSGTALDATDIGKLYVITASGTPANVGAYALAMKDNGANEIVVSPFGTYSNATGAFTTITPAVGDTIEVRATTATTLTGNIEGYGTFTGTQLGAAKVLFDSIHLASAGGASQASSVRACGLAFVYARSTFASIVLSGSAFNNAAEHFWRGGGGVPGCVMALRGGSSATWSQVGAIDGFVTTARGSRLSLTSDCYFQNTRVTPGAGGPIASAGCSWFDRVTASSSILIEPGAIFQQTGAVPDWGTNNAGFGTFVQSFGCYSFATKTTVNSGLGAGREASVGGADKLLAAVPYVEGANNATLVLTA